MNLVDGDIIGVGDLPSHLQKVRGTTLSSPTPTAFSGQDSSLREALQRMEKWMIERAMEKTGGNVMQAAKQLGIPRQTLQYKLSKQETD